MKTPRPRVVIGLIALLAGCASPGGLASRQAPKNTPQIAQAETPKSEGVRKEFRPNDPVADSRGITVDGFQKTAEDPVADVLEQARTEEQNKHYEEARNLYLSVLERQPNNAVANHRLGVIAAINKNYTEAERYYRVALRETPHEPGLLSDMGLTYLSQGRLNDSELSLQQALQYDSKHKAARQNLGMLYAQRFKTAGSSEDYDRSYEQLTLARNEEFAQETLHRMFPNGPPGGGRAVASENPFAPQESQENPFAAAGSAEPPVEAPPPTIRNPSRSGMTVAQTSGSGLTRGAPPKITPAVRAAYGPDTSRDGANDDQAVFGQSDGVHQPVNYSNVAGPVITPGRGSRADAMRGSAAAGEMGTTAATPPAFDEKAFAGAGSSSQGIPDWTGEVPAAPPANSAPATASAWAGGNSMAATSVGNDRSFSDLQRQAALLGMQAGMGNLFPVADTGAGAASTAQPLPGNAPVTLPATFAPSAAPAPNRGAAPVKQAGQTAWPQWPGAAASGSAPGANASPAGGPATSGNVVPAGGPFPQGGAAAIPTDVSSAVVDQFEAEMERQARNNRGLMPTANAAPMQ